MMKKRILLVGLLLLSLGAIAYFATQRFNSNDKTPLHISIFPEDALITLDGEMIEPGTQRLDTGVYSLKATRDGFDDYSKTVVLEKDEQTVAILMVPNTAEARGLSEKNQAAYMKVFGEGQRAASEIGKTFNDRNPIARKLPDKTFFYSIGYRMDQSDPSGNSIIIEIDASETYREAALFRIRQLGFDPTDFTINFRNYENPFSL